MEYRSTLSTLEELRQRGQWANQERDGRSDVVPVHLLKFDPAATNYSTINATWMSETAGGADVPARQPPGYRHPGAPCGDGIAGLQARGFGPCLQNRQDRELDRV